MDREQLKLKLAKFSETCAELGKPIKDICLVEAFPGDASTSFKLQVKVDWVDNMACFDALDFLFDVLWNTTEVETREKIFMIEVLDSSNRSHCEGTNIFSNKNIQQ